MATDPLKMLSPAARALLEEIPAVGAPVYETAVVTFIDILGFRSLVASKPPRQVANAIARLQETVHGTAAADDARPLNPSRVHAFSDCIVRVRPVSNGKEADTLAEELADLAGIQTALARTGIFIRGGVSSGEIHSTDTIVFGPALIRAYEMESQLAHAPRIIVDPVTIQAVRDRPVTNYRMRKDIAALRQSIRQADDGLWFIDYLRASTRMLSADSRAVRDLLRQHGDSVTAAAADIAVGSSVLPKYLWAARYHNASCARILKKSSVPGVTISKTAMPSYERLRPPLVLTRNGVV